MKNRFRLPAFAVSAALAMLVLDPAAAAECKGQSQSACAATASCAWVDSYTTSSGKTINGYCRAKTGGKEAKAAPSAPIKAASSQSGANATKR